MLEKQKSPHLRKIGHRFSCFLYFFIHPNPITQAQHASSLGTGALFLIFLESGRGRGHSYYLLALRLLDYMGFTMEATTDWKMGGGTHSSPTALGLGINASPHPKLPSFVRDWEGAQMCFILRDQTTGDHLFFKQNCG